MSDINATLQKLTHEFQSLREDDNSIKQRKAKKKRRKSSRRSRSSERRYRSRSRTRSNSPRRRQRSPSRSREGYSPRISRSGPDLPLEAEDYTPQVKPLETVRCFALEVEQATDHDPRVGVTHAHGVGATHDLGAGTIPVPEAEQDILDLVVDHLTQCLGVRPGKIFLTTQTTVKW